MNLAPRIASGLPLMLRSFPMMALMLVAACGAQSEASGRPAHGGEAARTPQGTAIEPDPSPAPEGGRPLRVRQLSPSTLAAKGFRVVRDEDEWPAAGAPVDFDEELVLIAAAGMGSGEAMTVTRAVAHRGAVHVTVVHSLPGRDCPTLAVDAWMGQEVAIERAEGPIQVHVEERRNPPCLEEPTATFECWTTDRPERRTRSLRSIEPVTVHCDASESRADEGRAAPERWTWQMITAPEGSDLEEGLLGEGPVIELALAAPGTYAFEVTITDAQGNQTTAGGSALIGPVSRSFDVTAMWESQNGEPVDAPLVVEVRHGEAVCALDVEPKPSWCVTRALGPPPGFPSIVQLPADTRGRFRITVRYPEGRPEPGVVKLTVAPDGTPTHVLRDDEPRPAGSRWLIGTVRMPRGNFSPAD